MIQKSVSLLAACALYGIKRLFRLLVSLANASRNEGIGLEILPLMLMVMIRLFA